MSGRQPPIDFPYLNWASAWVENETRGGVALRYSPSKGRKKHWSRTHQITFKKKLVIDKKVSMETLLEEIKQVASENFEF